MESLAQWKRAMTPGTKLRCVYRHYETKKTDEVITVAMVQGNGMYYTSETVLAKGYLRSWLEFPRAKELKFTDNGFELYLPTGKLISRYEWMPEEQVA